MFNKPPQTTPPIDNTPQNDEYWEISTLSVQFIDSTSSYSISLFNNWKIKKDKRGELRASSKIQIKDGDGDGLTDFNIHIYKVSDVSLEKKLSLIKDQYGNDQNDNIEKSSLAISGVNGLELTTIYDFMSTQYLTYIVLLPVKDLLLSLEYSVDAHYADVYLPLFKQSAQSFRLISAENLSNVISTPDSSIVGKLKFWQK
jgi:hypothetical protein